MAELPSYISLVRKYARTGVLLDTNILLVYVVGQYQPALIEKFKRTNTFTEKDYRFLVKLVSLFARVVTTPHVLTEVSNLAAHLNDPDRAACFTSFAAQIGTLEEHTEPAKTISTAPGFTRLGITDAALPLIARHRFLVVTADLELYAHLGRNGIDAVNFNHIRLEGWFT